MEHGMLIYADMVGCDLIAPEDGKKFSLEECYTAIGCELVEIVRLNDTSIRNDGKRCILIVDEEGMLKDLPYNRYASALAGMPICGKAILCPANMF